MSPRAITEHQFAAGNMTTGSTTACDGDASLTTEMDAWNGGINMTAAAVHRTRHALCGGIREIPTEVANCPNCGGAIHFVDTIEDTFERQVKSWFCSTCAGGGDITMSLRVRRGTEPRSAPMRVIEHRTSRVRVSP